MGASIKLSELHSFEVQEWAVEFHLLAGVAARWCAAAAAGTRIARSAALFRMIRAGRHLVDWE
jgi:hypothetical protein